MSGSRRKLTGFRIDSELLKRFQNALNDRDLNMSPVIEGWIRAYMCGELGLPGEIGTIGSTVNPVVPLDTKGDIAYTFSPEMLRSLEQAREAISAAIKLAGAEHGSPDAEASPAGESGEAGSVTKRLDQIEDATERLKAHRKGDPDRTKRATKKSS